MPYVTIDQYLVQVVAELTPENFPDTAADYASQFKGTDDEWMCLPRAQELWERDYARELVVMFRMGATPNEAAQVLLRCEGDLYLRGTPAENALEALCDLRTGALQDRMDREFNPTDL